MSARRQIGIRLSTLPAELYPRAHILPLDLIHKGRLNQQ